MEKEANAERKEEATAPKKKVQVEVDNFKST